MKRLFVTAMEYANDPNRHFLGTIASLGGVLTITGSAAKCSVFVLAMALLAGCSQSRPSALTPGAAKKYIVPGETTQAEVVETFGTPNVYTRKHGKEMWVYDKVSSRQTSAAFGLGGIGGGVGSGGFGGGGGAVGVGSTERSETTVMLIVYFDENDLVEDYKITQTKF